MTEPSGNACAVADSHLGRSLKALDLDAILSESPEPIRWVIKPWLVRSDIVCFAGEPKVGKSWTALDLAFALTTGSTFLGMSVESGQYRVLYVDAENNELMARRRIRQLASGRGLSVGRSAADNIRYISVRSLNLRAPDQLEELLHQVRGFKPDFIILDSLIRFHRGDENSNAEMSAFYAEVIRPVSAAADGSGVIMIHHLRKPDFNGGGADLAHRVRGASDILAEVDQLWTLSAKPDGTLTLRHERTRWAETAPDLNVSIEGESETEGVLLRATEAHSGPEEVIRRVLAEGAGSGAPRQDIVSALTDGRFKSAAKLATNHLGRLHTQRAVKKRTEGRETRYWLSEHAPSDAA